jgi:carbohydrate diacid regulator
MRRREGRAAADWARHRRRAPRDLAAAGAQLLDSTSNVARARFTRSQLARLSGENDFPVLRETLLAWCECGFNLVTTAQRLSIHRNTVIYRLDKVSRLTARDVRRPAVAIAL